MKIIMIAAPNSNSGKTLVSMGIIRALKNRGLDVSAFKTGPDFIDRKYIGVASGKSPGNLDMHLMGKDGIKNALGLNGGSFGVIEGVMGYFDGIYNTYENSSYDISKQLDIPAILVYSPKGEMFSVIPKVKGMVDFSKRRIKGIIFNKTSESIYRLLKEKTEEHIDIKVLGYIPEDSSLNIDNRYLGLIQPEENTEVDVMINKVANLVEKTVDLDSLINIAKEIEVEPFIYSPKTNIKVAIAYDEAFNFYYEENIKILEQICDVEYFSPLKDKNLPSADLVYIGGGYPELFKESLSNNASMLRDIKSYVENGGYLYGEGGGLMYLSDSIDDYPMCKVFEGKAIMTDRLQNFGYVNIEMNKDTILGKAGDSLVGQEFHHSVIETKLETVFKITKPMSNRNSKSGYSYKNTLATYQHINFLGNIEALNYLIERIQKDKERN